MFQKATRLVNFARCCSFIMSAGKHLDISSSTPNNKPLPDGVSKTYDVTSKWEPYWLCFWGTVSAFPCLVFFWETKTLTLETEEVVLNSRNCVKNTNKRLPYGELGSVDQSKNACGCYEVGGESIGRLSPGWGSTNELPEMLSILATLKHRQQQRGDQGQIQRTENLERKIDAIIQHFKIKIPDDLDIDQAPGAMSMKRY